MPPTDQLGEEFARLTDEELIDRLRSGYLTKVAADIIRRELSTRGVDLALALAQSAEATVSPRRISASIFTKFVALLARALRFPLRAVLGVEPLWVVIVFGAAFVFLLFKLTVYGLVQFLDLHPMPPYVLPIAYAATALTALAQAWYALALWGSAGRAKTIFWKIAVRILAALIALYAVLGTPGRIGVMQKYFSSPPSSVMGSLSNQ